MMLKIFMVAAGNQIFMSSWTQLLVSLEIPCNESWFKFMYEIYHTLFLQNLRQVTKTSSIVLVPRTAMMDVEFLSKPSKKQ